MCRAPDVRATFGAHEKSTVREVAQHPRCCRIGQPEETTGFGDRHAETRHLFELCPNSIDGCLPQKIRQPVWTARFPRMVEHLLLGLSDTNPIDDLGDAIGSARQRQRSLPCRRAGDGSLKKHNTVFCRDLDRRSLELRIQ